MRLKILVADDVPSNVKQLEAVASKLGHEVVTATDGIEAVEKYRENTPDLIIMDVMMPRLDGIEAVRQIRSLPSKQWVPIIFYSALDSTQDIIRGLEAGGDDYLGKPANLQLIRAKINSYARILTIQREVRGYMQELSDWRDDAEEQSKLGQHVVSRLLETEGLRDPMLQWMNTPAEAFSGDLVCAARGPGDVLYVMLADAAGHGLSAALSALPMSQVFYGMAAKGFPIHTIASELNRKLKSFLPIERFVAASLAAIDTRNQTIEVWNGGNPDMLLLQGDGHISVRWPSRHPPLGILPPELFNATTDTINYLHPGEMVLFSDGIIEAENPDGVRLNMQGLEALVCAAPSGGRLDALRSGLLKHLAGHQKHDDLSCIVVRVSTERREEVRLAQTAERADTPISDWRLDLSWGATELRSIDVVPAVLGFMGHIQAMKPHQGHLFLILSELFNNALDHGVLGLDSRLKNAEGGFERYLEERERGLAMLTDGRIGMNFHLHRQTDRPVLDICIEDSGQGFDYTALDHLFDVQTEAALPHGRGILLVKRLCEEVVYSGTGNRVSVRFAL